MADGRGRPKKAKESPVVQDSPIAEEYQEAARTGIFDPLAVAKAEKAEKTKKVVKPVEPEIVLEEPEVEPERDIFDAIESGEIVPVREPEACDNCHFKFGKPVCGSCIEYRKYKKLKEAK